MTLLELVVAIVIIALLIGILLPTVINVRAKSVQINCLANLRTMSTLVQVYAGENADSPPSWVERGVAYESDPSRWQEFASQGSTTFEHAKWLGYTDFKPDSASQYCPANTWHPEMYHTVASSDYRISSSFYIRPAYLDPNLPASAWYGKLGAGVQRFHSVRYPSDKVGLFEFFVWHGWRGRRCEGCEVGDLEFHNTDRRGSIVFVDGHGKLRPAADAVRPVRRYPTWPSHIYGTTPHGVYGRDFE